MDHQTKYCRLIGTSEQIEKFLDVRAKWHVDNVAVKVMEYLGLFPDDLEIKVCLFDSVKDVQDVYFMMYNRKFSGKTFMSKSMLTVYITVSCDIKKLIHEIAHIVVEKYFTEKVPHRIHELLAGDCHMNIRL